MVADHYTTTTAMWDFRFRNFRFSIGLLLLDTSIAENSTLVAKIRKEVSDSGFLEAFLESAPQLILQCMIVLLTGNISKLLTTRWLQNGMWLPLKMLRLLTRCASSRLVTNKHFIKRSWLIIAQFRWKKSSIFSLGQ